MYIRRKVFSLGEGNIDYNEVERFYSSAFDEGFDFYAQKMFGEYETRVMEVGKKLHASGMPLKQARELAIKQVQEEMNAKAGVQAAAATKYNETLGNLHGGKAISNDKAREILGLVGELDQSNESTKKALEELRGQYKAQGTFLEQAQKNSNYFENLTKEQKEALAKAKTKQEGLEKSLRKWKVGAGIGAGVAAAGGLGAYYLGKRNKDR